MRTFGNWYLLALLLLGGAAQGQAQKAHGYIFVAPGSSPSGYTEHAGVGGELALPKRFGAGLELGLHGQAKGLTRVRDVGLLVSLNGYFHLPLSKSNTNWDPFVAAGYTSASQIEVCLFQTRCQSGSRNLFNFGGGSNYWFANHFGVRAEFRDHVGNVHRGRAGHYWGVRFALTFR